jgi:hypothetical protein
MKFEDLKNESKNEFSDISSEEYRRYDFKEYSITINSPIALSVSKSGGHRVLDAEGKSHYLMPSRNHLEWKAKDGQPHFVV